MRLEAIPSCVECSYHHVFQTFAAPSGPSSLFASRKQKMDRTASLVALSNPFLSKTILKSRNLRKVSRCRKIRRSCSSNLDGVHPKEPSSEGLPNVWGQATEEGNTGHRKKKVHYAVSKKSPHETNKDSFLNSRFDFLEPMMLGIKPEFPDWPDRETVVWATMEQKAKSLEIPLSLRIIKKKLQLEEGFSDSKESPYCSVKAAFASMVFIIVELQSHALKMRESLCHEDLDIISAKVQKEMHSSFVWLFQQVFSRTPALMLHVMVLLANFSVYSASHNVNIEPKVDLLSTDHKPIEQYSQIDSSVSSIIGDSVYPVEHLENAVEMDLWNSMVDDATKMRVEDDEVLDHETMRYFVSPVSVELEPDGYEDYLRTDLLYQMNLALEPSNPLLLCNYAQFLHLVARDYDRAEECFKRAVQVLPPDAESLSQYANFLWTVRRDFWGAEERFLQALSVEPDNSYYASRYANFLWSTGGEETCFPINDPHHPNL